MSKAALWAIAALGAAATGLAAEPPIRDPMRPFSPAPGARGAEIAAPRYVLTAVLISAARRVAVIDGKALIAGDDVDGARVASVAPGRVELQRGAERIVLELPAPAALRPRNDDGRGER